MPHSFPIKDGHIALHRDPITDDRVKALLASHLHDMSQYSPEHSVHALDADALAGEEISFWTAWEAGTLLGAVALKRIDATHGELKSMRTDPAHRGRGVARQMLRFVVGEARRRGYDRLSLETGSAAQFLPARRLYTTAGFVECEAFADYVTDPFSVFMSLPLGS